jgi:uncharacterized protein (TIGR04222 family)
MFPFTLAGPEFLALFTFFAFVVIAAYFATVRARAATGSAPRLNELAGNPYQVAYLRGGEREVLHVAIFNLVDRGLLENEGKTVRTKRGRGADFSRQPIDKAILQLCEGRVLDADALARFPQVRKAADEYRKPLESRGLLLGEEAIRFVKTGFLVALGLVAGVAILRVVQAISRGQANVLGLLFLTVVTAAILVVISRRRKTAAGDQALASLARLIDRVRGAARLRPGGATNEALLYAAVFGVLALPSLAFAFVQQLYPRPQPSNGSGGDGGGSCSSGCGGGGGCGGCGG